MSAFQTKKLVKHLNVIILGVDWNNSICTGLDEVVNKQPAYRSEDVLECQNDYASGNLIHFEFISLYISLISILFP